MPRLLAQLDTRTTAGTARKRTRQPEAPTPQRGVTAPAKPLTARQMEMSSHALHQLWERLRGTLLATPCGTLSEPPAAAYSAVSSDLGRESLDRLWQQGFGPSATVEDLFLHLLAHTEFFNRLAWLVAFCLLSRVDFALHVRRRLSGLPTAVTAATAGAAYSATTWDSSALVCDEFQALFTAYCLAIKWQCDYNVTVRYLVNLLPHNKTARERITRATITMETILLESLGYDCGISPDALGDLVQQYTLPEERARLADLVPRLADGSDDGVRASFLYDSPDGCCASRLDRS